MIKINLDQLIDELVYAENELMPFENSKGIIKHDYSEIKYNFHRLVSFNYILCLITGKEVVFDINIKRMNNIANKASRKGYCEFLNAIIQNGEIIYSIADNYCTYLEAMDFWENKYYDQLRKYSEKDFIDLILGFYSTYGNEYYNIAKRYFDEKRINIGCEAITDCDGFYATIPMISSGYIMIRKDAYNSTVAKDVVHEIAHAIDSERFLFSQQKKILLNEDYLVEVPSTTFEMAFLNYLKDNYIDRDGALILLNEKTSKLNGYLNVLRECLSKDISVYEDGYAIDKEGNEYYLNSNVFYGLGYYMALHLNLIDQKDKKEFLRVYNDIITMRKEMPFEQVIETTGFSVEDYVTGKYVVPKIENDFMELKKRYNQL